MSTRRKRKQRQEARRMRAMAGGSWGLPRRECTLVICDELGQFDDVPSIATVADIEKHHAHGSFTAGLLHGYFEHVVPHLPTVQFVKVKP